MKEGLKNDTHLLFPHLLFLYFLQCIFIPSLNLKSNKSPLKQSFYQQSIQPGPKPYIFLLGLVLCIENSLVCTSGALLLTFLYVQKMHEFKHCEYNFLYLKKTCSLIMYNYCLLLEYYCLLHLNTTRSPSSHSFNFYCFLNITREYVLIVFLILHKTDHVYIRVNILAVFLYTSHIYQVNLYMYMHITCKQKRK